MALLEVRNLTVEVGERKLVDAVSFSLDAGGRLGLIGESGSGKSLTARAILGLLDRRMRVSGSVLLDGHEVVGRPEADLIPLRGPIATMVFQEPLTALDPLMRVGRQVAEPLERQARRRGQGLTSGEVQRRVLQLLQQVSLADPERIAEAYPHELSGGQRQRIAIAMALSCQPKLLIADEPTTALDVTTQAEILDLLDRITRQNDMALLFISHDLPVVARVAPEAIVLKSGRVVEGGAVSSLFAAPQDPYTQSLVAAARRLDNVLRGRA